MPRIVPTVGLMTEIVVFKYDKCTHRNLCMFNTNRLYDVINV
jgi:hypothetical protein